MARTAAVDFVLPNRAGRGMPSAESPTAGRGNRGNRLGQDAELLEDALIVERDPISAVQLDDARALNALREVFVGSADDYAIDPRVMTRLGCSGGERVIGLELHHGPNDEAGSRESLLE